MAVAFGFQDALWNLITYCAATGGSLLVIGSAAGVAFMGMASWRMMGWLDISPEMMGGWVSFFFKKIYYEPLFEFVFLGYSLNFGDVTWDIFNQHL